MRKVYRNCSLALFWLTALLFTASCLGKCGPHIFPPPSGTEKSKDKEKDKEKGKKEKSHTERTEVDASPGDNTQADNSVPDENTGGDQQSGDQVMSDEGTVDTVPSDQSTGDSGMPDNGSAGDEPPVDQGQPDTTTGSDQTPDTGTGQDTVGNDSNTSVDQPHVCPDENKDTGEDPRCALKLKGAEIFCEVPVAAGNGNVYQEYWGTDDQGNAMNGKLVAGSFISPNTVRFYWPGGANVKAGVIYFNQSTDPNIKKYSGAHQCTAEVVGVDLASRNMNMWCWASVKGFEFIASPDPAGACKYGTNDSCTPTKALYTDVFKRTCQMTDATKTPLLVVNLQEFNLWRQGLGCKN